jgi:translocation and assembly module TamB
VAAGPIAGDISGDLAVNLNTYAVQGELAIANPRIGRIAADLFQGTIRFADGVVTLTDGVIQQGESQITLGGTIPIAGTQPVDFRITLDQVRVQNILQTLSLFEFGDFATGLQSPDLAGAADVQTIPINVSELSLLNQLRRLSEIETLLAQQQAEEDAEPLPALAELQGTISGTIAFTGALETGLDVAFDLQGQDWIWGDYAINQVIAEGSFQDGILTALPVRVEVDEGFVAFTGQVGAEQLSGQVQASDLPVELLEPVLTQLPVDVDGQLDAIATLTGSLDRPNVLGEIILESGRVNDQPVERAQAIFGYENARFNFTSDILVAGTEPIDIVGSIPIALPFAEVQPVSDQISIRADVEDEGLAIVNLFTNRVTWVDGQGQLELAVEGTLNQPIVDGLLTVQNATLESQALADPLTDVTGIVRLNDNQLVVDQLLANYNDDRVTAAGILPLFASQSEVANPLTVAFNDLTLDLNGFYEGDVSGNVILTGAALEPTIGGTIRLTDGEVIIGAGTAAEDEETEGVEVAEIGEIEEASRPLAIPDTAAATAMLPDGTPAVSSPFPVAFNDLQIVLAEDVRVTREPILSFEVAGDLTLNGTLNNLQPQGAVELTSGQINLFATQFVLTQGEEQIVRFTPETGLDPLLDIQLFALVPQVTGNLVSTPTPTLPGSSDVAETPDFFGTVRTIRVEASVTGRASELEQNLQLTSDPNRSEAEIIALLGRSYLNTLQADPLLGAATLAGSALFGGDLQVLITELGQAIGLSELRVFPTLVTDEEAGDASVLGLAVEGVVDLTDDFSVSVAGVAGAEDPIRYSVIYRINEEIRVQTSTNLSGDSRAVLQYETTF